MVERCPASTGIQIRQQWGQGLPDFDGAQWQAMLTPLLRAIFAPVPPRQREKPDRRAALEDQRHQHGHRALRSRRVSLRADARVGPTSASFLIHVRAGSRAPGLPVLRRLPYGTWLSVFGGVPVRVIDAKIAIATSAGRAASRYRLVTTLADPARYPAGEVIVLYRERW